MLIGVKRRFIFIANTKAASTALELALVQAAEIERGTTPQRKHITMREVLVEYDFLFSRPGLARQGFFAFGVMREPLDWIGSWFRYRRSNKVQAPLPEGMSFEDFWRRADWNRFDAKGRPWLQAERFTDAAGEPLVDMIIPYRHLAADYAEVAAALGLNGKLGLANVSLEPPGDGVIPPHLEDEVRAHYAQDYQLLARLDAINAKGREKLAARLAARQTRQAQAAQEAP